MLNEQYGIVVLEAIVPAASGKDPNTAAVESTTIPKRIVSVKAGSVPDGEQLDCLL